MRSIPHQGRNDSLRDPRAEEWWNALPLSERIEFQMTEVLCILGKIGAELRTEEGRPFRWMQKSVDSAFADADRILRMLEGSAEP